MNQPRYFFFGAFFVALVAVSALSAFGAHPDFFAPVPQRAMILAPPDDARAIDGARGHITSHPNRGIGDQLEFARFINIPDASVRDDGVIRASPHVHRFTLPLGTAGQGSVQDASISADQTGRGSSPWPTSS